MKTHTRKLLSIIPLLPLLMANSPAPYRPYIITEDYYNFELAYVSEETHYNYNFYHLHLKNTGNGYIDYINIQNHNNSTSFYGTYEGADMCYPFLECVIEPGFDAEIVVATQEKIPASKLFDKYARAYTMVAPEVTLWGDQKVSYSLDDSYPSSSRFIYKVDVAFNNMAEEDYVYGAAVQLTYDGTSCYIVDENIDDGLTFTSREQLDLEKLTVNTVVALKSRGSRNAYDGYFVGFQDAMKPLLLFLGIFLLLLSVGIFSAIFFPAMARRKRRLRAMQDQDKK